LSARRAQPQRVELDLVIRPYGCVETVAHRPGQRLLMQRDEACVLADQLERLDHHRRSPRRIALAERHGGQPVDLAVAVAAEIEPCAIAFVVPASGDIVEYVPGIERRRRPPEQIERAVLAAAGQHLLEEKRLGLRVQADANVDPREHLHDREADLLVVDIAVVRAVHHNVEAVLITGVTQ
jgi:hypothetical protein